MATLTIQTPDNKKNKISNIVQVESVNVIASNDKLTKAEQISLDKSIKEAKLIKEGKMKAYSFDDLWD